VCVSWNRDTLDLPFCVRFFEPQMIDDIDSPVVGVFAFIPGLTVR